MVRLTSLLISLAFLFTSVQPDWGQSPIRRYAHQLQPPSLFSEDARRESEEREVLDVISQSEKRRGYVEKALSNPESTARALGAVRRLSAKMDHLSFADMLFLLNESKINEARKIALDIARSIKILGRVYWDPSGEESQALYKNLVEDSKKEIEKIKALRAKMLLPPEEKGIERRQALRDLASRIDAEVVKKGYAVVSFIGRAGVGKTTITGVVSKGINGVRARNILDLSVDKLDNDIEVINKIIDNRGILNVPLASLSDGQYGQLMAIAKKMDIPIRKSASHTFLNYFYRHILGENDFTRSTIKRHYKLLGVGSTNAISAKKIRDLTASEKDRVYAIAQEIGIGRPDIDGTPNATLFALYREYMKQRFIDKVERDAPALDEVKLFVVEGTYASRGEDIFGEVSDETMSAKTGRLNYDIKVFIKVDEATRKDRIKNRNRADKQYQLSLLPVYEATYIPTLDLEEYDADIVLDNSKWTNDYQSLELKSKVLLQFGIVSESAKDMLRRLMAGSRAPDIFVLPPEMFRENRSFADLEFVFYYNRFIKQGKPTIVVGMPEQLKRLRTIMQRSLVGADDKEIDDFDIDSEYKEFLKLARYHYAIKDNGRVKTVDELINFVAFDEDGKAHVEAKTEKGEPVSTIEIESLKLGEFRVKETIVGQKKAEEYPPVSVDYRLPEPRLLEIPSEYKEALSIENKPRFGITPLGTSDGFDPNGDTTSFILWVDGKGILVDPSPEAIMYIRQLGMTDRDIPYILLTHNHADHDRGVWAWILFGRKVNLIASGPVYKDFVKKSKALIGEGVDVASFVKHTHIYADRDNEIDLEGGGRFTLRPRYNLHSIPTNGFMVEYKGKRFGYSCDCEYDLALINKFYLDGKMSKRLKDAQKYFLWDWDKDADIASVVDKLFAKGAIRPEEQALLKAYHARAPKANPEEILFAIFKGSKIAFEREVELEYAFLREMAVPKADMMFHDGSLAAIHTQPKTLAKLSDKVQDVLYLVHVSDAKVNEVKTATEGFRLKKPELFKTYVLVESDEQLKNKLIAEQIAVISFLDEEDAGDSVISSFFLAGEDETLKDNDVIIEAGKSITNDEDRFYLIIEGNVEVRDNRSDGKVLATLGAGNTIGEWALYESLIADSAMRSATVVAKGRVILKSFTRAQLKELIRLVPEAGKRLQLIKENLPYLQKARSRQATEIRRPSKSGGTETSLPKNPLAKLSDSQLAKLAWKSEVREFKRGENIVTEGEKGNEFYILKMGTLDVSTKERGVVASLQRSGDFFGEMALLDVDSLRKATVKVISDKAVVYKISRQLFERMMKEWPVFKLGISAAAESRRAVSVSNLQAPSAFSHEVLQFEAIAGSLSAFTGRRKDELQQILLNTPDGQRLLDSLTLISSININDPTGLLKNIKHPKPALYVLAAHLDDANAPKPQFVSRSEDRSILILRNTEKILALVDRYRQKLLVKDAEKKAREAKEETGTVLVLVDLREEIAPLRAKLQTIKDRIEIIKDMLGAGAKVAGLDELEKRVDEHLEIVKGLEQKADELKPEDIEFVAEGVDALSQNDELLNILLRLLNGALKKGRELASDLSRAREENARLKAENGDLKGRLERKDTDLGVALQAKAESDKEWEVLGRGWTEELSRLDSELDIKTTDLAAANAKADGLEDEIGRLRKMIEDLQVRLRLASSRAFAMINIKSEEMKRLELKNKADHIRLGEEFARLGMELAEALKDIREKDEQLTSSLERIISLKEELDSVKNSLLEREALLKEKTALLEAKGKELERLTKAKRSADDNIDALEADIAALREADRINKERIAELEGILSEAGRDKEKILSELESARHMARELQKDLEGLQRENQGLADSVAELTRGRSAAQLEASRLKSVIAEISGERDRLKIILSEKEKRLGEFGKDTAELRADLEKESQEIIKLRQEDQDLRRQLAEKEKEKELLSRSITEKDSAITELRRELDGLRGERSKVQALELEEHALTESIKTKEAALSRLDEERARLEGERARLASDIERLNGELARLRGLLSEAEAKQKDLRRKYEEAEARYGDLWEIVQRKHQLILMIDAAKPVAARFFRVDAPRYSKGSEKSNIDFKYFSDPQKGIRYDIRISLEILPEGGDGAKKIWLYFVPKQINAEGKIIKELSERKLLLGPEIYDIDKLQSQLERAAVEANKILKAQGLPEPRPVSERLATASFALHTAP